MTVMHDDGCRATLHVTHGPMIAHRVVVTTTPVARLVGQSPTRVTLSLEGPRGGLWAHTQLTVADARALAEALVKYAEEVAAVGP